jgi:hypothetical protein
MQHGCVPGNFDRWAEQAWAAARSQAWAVRVVDEVAHSRVGDEGRIIELVVADLVDDGGKGAGGRLKSSMGLLG